MVCCVAFVTSLAEVWIEIFGNSEEIHFKSVTSLAEVWIEISDTCLISSYTGVTSLAEVWIEMWSCMGCS